jgi:hypothetical protein
MLALRNLSDLSIAELHQWIDDAQLKLGELHGLVETTWFRPSANAPAESPVASQTQSQEKGSQTQSQGQSSSDPEVSAHSRST